MAPGWELRVRVRPRRPRVRSTLGEEAEEEEDASEDGTRGSRSRSRHPNLFVRLPRGVARQLRDSSSSLSSVTSSGALPWRQGWSRQPPPRNRGWDEDPEEVEFLPLKLEFGASREGAPPIVVYGSYNGGEAVALGTSGSGRSRTLHSDAADVDAIDLPIDLVPASLLPAATAVGIRDSIASSDLNDEGPCEKDGHDGVAPLFVRVSVADRCHDAERVRVQALTRDDYALLCHSAPFLEDGGWLRTVSVVYPHQVVSVPTHDGNDFARCLVLPNEGDASHPLTGACYRLVAATQVIVLPPSDADSGGDVDDHEENVFLVVVPSAFDCNPSMHDLAAQLGASLLSVGQGRAIVHPDVAPWITRRFSVCPNADPDREGFLALLEGPDGRTHHVPDEPKDSANTVVRRRSIIVRLEASASVPGTGIVLHPLTRIDMQLRLLTDQVRVRPLSIENEVSIGRIRDDLMHPSPAMRLGWERVVLRPHHAEAEWRRPSIEPDSNRASSESSSFRIDIEQSFWTSEEVHDIPIRIGSLLDPSYMAKSTRSSASPDTSTFRSLCRLVLTSNSAENDLTIDEEEYIMAQDVPGLLDVESHQLPCVAIHTQVLTDPLKCFHPNVKSSVSLLKAWRSASGTSTLVCGDIGSGKTYTALIMGAAAVLSKNRSVHYLDCRRLKNAEGMRLQGIMDELLEVLQLAQQADPATLILDDLDELLPGIGAGTSTANPSVQLHNPALVDQCHALQGLLRHLLRSILEASGDMELVITGKDPEILASTVRGDFPVESTIQLPILGDEERIHLFHSFLDRLWAQHDTAEQRLCHQVTLGTGFGRKTSGFKPLDLLQLAECYHRALYLGGSTNPCHLLEDVLHNYVPLSQRRASIETFRREYSLQDIGGLRAVKEALESTILSPAKYRRIYQRAQIRLPRGILLFGPPGCGKSYIVPALARDCGYPTILCRGAEIVDKYIGASEMKVRELFARAASVAPSILWIEDLDALAPRRGSDSTGVTDRIVNQLLTFLDGVEDSSVSGTVYVVATSSRPDKIDPALLRPGRLERHLYVGLPESDGEFIDVLVKISARFNLSLDLKEDLQYGRFLATLKEHVPTLTMLTPADVRSAFVTAQIAAAHATIDEGVGGDGQDQVPFVSSVQLLFAFRSTKPSLSTKDRTTLDAVYSGFRKLRTIPTEAESPPTELKVALL